MCSLATLKEVEYAYAFIKRICDEVGSGCPGSLQERDRAIMVKDELEKITDSVETEDFRFAPNAFLGWFRIGMIMVIISVVFFYISLLDIFSITFAILACAIATFLFLIMEFEFLYSRQFIDWFYKKKTSMNVIGKIRPKEGELVERILIFSGHHDSALQFTWFRYLKSGFYFAVVIIVLTVFSLLLCSIIHLFSIAFSIPDQWNVNLFLVLTWSLFPAGVIFGIFFTERGKNGGLVPGAVDNLSGVSLAIVIARILKLHPEIHPPNTEVRIISFGAEEASIRGSRAYIHKHLAELKSHDAVCINFESIACPEITIYKSDLNNSLKFDPAIVVAVNEAALKAGVPYNIKSFPFGGAATDAASFCRVGLKSISLSALGPSKHMLTYYHQEFDTPNKININALQNVLNITIEFVKRFNHEDEKGIK